MSPRRQWNDQSLAAERHQVGAEPRDRDGCTPRVDLPRVHLLLTAHGHIEEPALRGAAQASRCPIEVVDEGRRSSSTTSTSSGISARATNCSGSLRRTCALHAGRGGTPRPELAGCCRYTAIRDQDRSQLAEHDNDDGEPTRKAFREALLSFTCISSDQPRRRHPVANQIRADQGVDDAAPKARSGSSATAASFADGKVATARSSSCSTAIM